MSTIKILEWVNLGLAWFVVFTFGGDRKGWRYWPFVVLFALAVSCYGVINYIEGAQAVRECLQTNELEC